MNKNTLFSYTHTLTPTLLNDFRIGYHRLDFDTLNHFSVERHAGRRHGARHSRLRRRHQVQQSRPAEHQHQHLLRPGEAERTGTSSTRLPGVGCPRLEPRLAQRPGRLRPAAAGDRTARGERPRRLFNFTGDITGYSVADFMLGLPRTVDYRRPTDPGACRRLAQRVLRQRRLAGDANLTLSLGLRYELNTPVQTYAGLADYAWPRISLTIIPSTAFRRGFKFHRAEQQGLGAAARRDLSPQREDGGARRVRDLLQPEQMNSFTFLTNNPPLAAASTYDVGSGNPTLSFDQPTGASARSVCRTSFRRRGIFRTPGRISGASTCSGSSGRRRWICSTSAPTRALDRSFFNNTPAPGAGAVDPRRPTSAFRSRRVIQNDLIADYDAVTFICGSAYHGLQADAHYTWSRTATWPRTPTAAARRWTTTTSGADYGAANWDVPHRFVATYLYDVPFLKNFDAAGAEYLVAGWRGRRLTTSERVAAQRDAQHRPGEHRDHRQQRPDLVGPCPS